MTALGIVELGAVCARMRARSLDLFELVGGWVTTTPPGDDQRLFAEACHRHAWHADLWAARAPKIPPVDLEAATAAARGQLPDVDPRRRADAYTTILDDLASELDELATSVDADLDPCTARTVTLVARDLHLLRSALVAPR